MPAALKECHHQLRRLGRWHTFDVIVAYPFTALPSFAPLAAPADDPGAPLPAEPFISSMADCVCAERNKKPDMRSVSAIALKR